MPARLARRARLNRLLGERDFCVMQTLLSKRRTEAENRPQIAGFFAFKRRQFGWRKRRRFANSESASELRRGSSASGDVAHVPTWVTFSLDARERAQNEKAKNGGLSVLVISQRALIELARASAEQLECFSYPPG